MRDGETYARLLADARYVASRNKPSVVGATILLGLIFIAIAGPSLAPYDPLDTSAAPSLAPPSLSHRSARMLSDGTFSVAFIVATRLDLTMAHAAVIAPFFCGTALGAAAGYVGGWVDVAAGRINDTIMAFPLFVLAMGIVAALGNSVANIVLATAIINLPFYARFARAEVNVRRTLTHVEPARWAARALPKFSLPTSCRTFSRRWSCRPRSTWVGQS